MKKFGKIFSIFLLLLVFVGCGKKTETAIFKRPEPISVDVLIVVEHEGDKVTNVFGKTIFDNKKLQITDEKIAEQLVEAIEATTDLESPEMKYTETETVTTYKVSKKMLDSSKGFKEVEKELVAQWFEKE